MASARYAPLDISGWTVMVTGASSGFGLATAWRFAELGRGAAPGSRLPRGVKCHCFPLDMMDIPKVEAAATLLPADFAEATADENATEDVVRMMTTNVSALIVCTATFAKGMKKRGRGHVINVGSVSGHEVYGGGSAYCAHAVTAFTSAARHDLVGTPIRVTCISPGFAETEFSLVRFKRVPAASRGWRPPPPRKTPFFRADEKKAASVYTDLVPLYADDIADQIVYAATRPAHVQIADIICWPTNQAGPTNIARVGASLGAPAK
ncbi:hypothetical protein JL720_6268 [Aureococcus anophagefferens]|nr:hypothetical protein JL720_6268 [Aureococcus anophagefferens]